MKAASDRFARSDRDIYFLFHRENCLENARDNLHTLFDDIDSEMMGKKQQQKNMK